MKIFVLTVISFFLSLAVSGQEEGRIARIALIADIQYCDCPDSKGRMYRSSLERLDKCIPIINRERVDFTVDLGDIVDRNVENNLDTVLGYLHKLKNPLFCVMGNHDVKGVYQKGYKGLTGDFALDKYMEDLSIPANYYSKETGKAIYIFMDTNEISSYSIDSSDLQKKEELSWWIRVAMSSQRNNIKPYNGAVSKRQLQWIEHLLKRAENENKIIILFSHHPLYPENGYQALNNREILELISRYKCVKAVFSGHHHSGNITSYHGIPVITLKGLVEYDAFAIIDVFSDKIDMKGFGKMESLTFQ
jgi:3',5'-cyclic AMP phosphodiesterase CpdA